MDATPVQKRTRYRRPPIIERVISITADIDEDIFFARFDAWRSIVEESFPDYDPIQQWLLGFSMHGDIPMLDDSPPEIQVTHRFWRKSPDGARFLSMRLLPERLTLNLHPIGDNPQQFETLYNEMQLWLPQWAAHFSVTEFSVVQLDYINILGPNTTPQLVDKQSGSVAVGKSLTVCNNIPGTHEGLLMPLDCQMSVAIDRTRITRFNLNIQAVQTKKNAAPAVRVDFQAVTNRPQKKSFSLSEALSETVYLHDVIIEKFESIFTAEARTTFGPLP